MKFSHKNLLRLEGIVIEKNIFFQIIMFHTLFVVCIFRMCYVSLDNICRLFQLPR